MTSILDPVRHERLIANLDNYCETANVPPKYVHQSMKALLPADAPEIEWVTRFNHYRREGVGGLLFIGKVKAPTVDERMMAMTGALLRNYLDARIVPLNTLLSVQEDGGSLDPTVMMIPNLFIAGAAGKTLPAWKAQQVYDVLLARLTQSKPTVLYVEDMAALALQYGSVFAGHLNTHYKHIGG